MPVPFSIKIIPILPKNKDFPMNQWATFEKLLEVYMRGKLANDLKKDMDKTTEKWSHAPTMSTRFTRPHRDFWLTVLPSGRNTLLWKRVSRGTKPHMIVARGIVGKKGYFGRPGKVELVFPREYDPHTTPGGKTGGPGRRYGDIVRVPSVSHPGIEPRHFEEHIIAKRKNGIVRSIALIARQAFGSGGGAKT